jgi:hypothetical protein
MKKKIAKDDKERVKKTTETCRKSISVDCNRCITRRGKSPLAAFHRMHILSKSCNFHKHPRLLQINYVQSEAGNAAVMQ